VVFLIAGLFGRIIDQKAQRRPIARLVFLGAFGLALVMWAALAVRRGGISIYTEQTSDGARA